MVRGVANLVDMEAGSNNTLVSCYVKYVVLGDDLGDLSSGENTILVGNLDPTAMATLRSNVEAAVKSDMEIHEIEFDLLDTVVLL